MKSQMKHQDWILAAAEAKLVRFEDAAVTIKGVPTKDAEVKVDFDAAVFVIESAEDAEKLYKLAEDGRGTDAEGNPKANPLATLLAYAYGLNCRAKVRAQYEAQFEDPDKAVKKIAEMLVKAGQFKSFDKALAAAKLMREQPEDE